MNDHRDTQLGEQLKALAEPEHEPTYWGQVRTQVAEAAAEKRRRPSLVERLRRLVPSRRVSLALVTAAVMIVAAAAVLFGLPTAAERTGPQPVNAAEVLRRTLQALADARTMQAVVVVEYMEWDVSGGIHTGTTDRFRVRSLADGSYRIEFFGAQPAGASPSPAPPWSHRGRDLRRLDRCAARVQARSWCRRDDRLPHRAAGWVRRARPGRRRPGRRPRRRSKRAPGSGSRRTLDDDLPGQAGMGRHLLRAPGAVAAQHQ